MAGSPASTIRLRVRFGDFKLHEANALLLRSGSAISLSPTPFKLLCALVRHPGSSLTKHALLDEVWGHRFVSDSVLKGTISDIRTVLEDDPRTPRFSATKLALERSGCRGFSESVELLGRGRSASMHARQRLTAA
jgi:DNA-binding winged helix-turn-helix (wHTH) protein